MSSSTSVPFFSMGLSTFQVPKEMFSENRNKLLQSLRKELPNHDCMVYLEGGNAVTRFDTDHEPIFRQESYFHYLFGVREPDFRGGINIKSGESYLFCPKLPQEYATIMGHIATCEEIKNEYLVDHVMNLAVGWVLSHRPQHSCQLLEINTYEETAVTCYVPSISGLLSAPRDLYMHMKKQLSSVLSYRPQDSCQLLEIYTVMKKKLETDVICHPIDLRTAVSS